MIKILISTIAISALFFGCASKEPLSTVEATDYAMSCNALISEISNIRSQLKTEEDKNLAKNIVGKTLTLGIYSANDDKALLLRERAKSLQLIYTIKQAKNECKQLTEKDLKVDSMPVHEIKNIKTQTNELKN
ncbi:hypothetical protein [Sulfurospirillum sp. 1612]|uniref:hypothetical protein n=1 Tax=Sulfurospirillum sp. 1612 TaxID=3094835 RepID=UPI002F950102